MAKHKGHRKIILQPPATPPATPKDDAGMSWTQLLGSLVIAAAVGIGLVTIVGWVDVYMRPPPGWVCWNIEQVTVEGRRQRSNCAPIPGWHFERWPDGATVAVPDYVRRVRD